MMKIKTISFYLLLGIFTFTSCGDTGSKSEAKESTEMEDDATDMKSEPEYTSDYICPMHCKGSGSDSPGECPACGMAYVKNQDSDAHEGHNHDNEGHNHDH